MDEKEAWDMLHGNKCAQKSLSKVLDEMGFDKDSYIVVRRNGPRLKVRENDVWSCPEELEESAYYSFGYNHRHPSSKYKNDNFVKDDFDAIDLEMAEYARKYRDGTLVNGMTGANNGVFCAMAHGGDEFILTKDPEITRQLEAQLHFIPNQLGVPLSNGGYIIDDKQRKDWERAEACSKSAVVERMRGIKSRPKTIKSPFCDEYGNMKQDYKRFRVDEFCR
ncbi:MAG: hypothetical protein IJ660_00645 [Alphaproteobacteria bacterium]|nr:hypothetical protein [Alphaproteobacteria bacterium]